LFSLRQPDDAGAVAKEWQFDNDEPTEEGDRGQEMAPRLCIFNSDAVEEERWSLGGSESFRLIWN
jgi:hypothetical protein